MSPGTGRIAVLLKQVPDFEEMAIGPDYRLDRSSPKAKISSYCQRAISQGVELAGSLGADLTLITMGPPRAEDALREAFAWGRDRGVEARAVLVSDPTFSGSDTLATARTLVASLSKCGPFDLVLAGNASLDSDTGQVPAQVAELLGWGLLPSVRTLAVREEPTSFTVRAQLEHDTCLVEAEATGPVVITCAERLCAPCKVDFGAWAGLDLGPHLTVLGAADLGPGRWGQAGSPTRVIGVRNLPRQQSSGKVLLAGSPAELAASAVDFLRQAGADVGAPAPSPAAPPSRFPCPDPMAPPPSLQSRVSRATRPFGGLPIVVIGEPGDTLTTRELLSCARSLGDPLVLLCDAGDVEGAVGKADGVCDELITFDATTPAALVGPLAGWCGSRKPGVVLVPFTFWGREVAGRLAARLDAGLAGGVTGFDREEGEVVACKPDFGGDTMATIGFAGPPAIATVIPGSLPAAPQPGDPPPGDPPHAGIHPPSSSLHCPPDLRVSYLSRHTTDDTSALHGASTLICVGAGVDPSHYPDIEELATALGGAPIVATRKVTDKGWLPRSRQIGITGRHVAPDLYVAIGVSGRPSHLAGIRHAATVLSINPDPDAAMARRADVSLVAPFEEVVPALVAQLAGLRSRPGAVD